MIKQMEVLRWIVGENGGEKETVGATVGLIILMRGEAGLQPLDAKGPLPVTQLKGTPSREPCPNTVSPDSVSVSRVGFPTIKQWHFSESVNANDLMLPQ